MILMFIPEIRVPLPVCISLKEDMVNRTRGLNRQGKIAQNQKSRAKFRNYQRKALY